MIRIIREGPGAYKAADGPLSVTIIRNTDLDGPDKWIAAANFDRWTITDPGPSKRWAVKQAIGMINEALSSIKMKENDDD